MLTVKIQGRLLAVDPAHALRGKDVHGDALARRRQHVTHTSVHDGLQGDWTEALPVEPEPFGDDRTPNEWEM